MAAWMRLKNQTPQRLRRYPRQYRRALPSRFLRPRHLTRVGACVSYCLCQKVNVATHSGTKSLNLKFSWRRAIVSVETRHATMIALRDKRVAVLVVAQAALVAGIGSVVRVVASIRNQADANPGQRALLDFRQEPHANLAYSRPQR